VSGSAAGSAAGGERLYEGKAKVLYATDRPGVVRLVFKDEATAGDGAKRAVFPEKGRLNRAISAALFRVVAAAGVPVHLVDEAGEDALLVRRLHMIPVEFVVRNVAAGSLAKRLGIETGRAFPQPVLEHYLKNDELHDPWVNGTHVEALGVARAADLEEGDALARRVNDALRPFLQERGLLLVDFKLEFGRDDSGALVLGDEISPDTCRFWDAETREVLDKDRFRRDMGDVLGAYREVFRRVCG
jgi:phosphoribosylaminoimidazole-succinocarboxamide synthase